MQQRCSKGSSWTYLPTNTARCLRLSKPISSRLPVPLGSLLEFLSVGLRIFRSPSRFQPGAIGLRGGHASDLHVPKSRRRAFLPARSPDPFRRHGFCRPPPHQVTLGAQDRRARARRRGPLPQLGPTLRSAAGPHCIHGLPPCCPRPRSRAIFLGSASWPFITSRSRIAYSWNLQAMYNDPSDAQFPAAAFAARTEISPWRRQRSRGGAAQIFRGPRSLVRN